MRSIPVLALAAALLLAGCAGSGGSAPSAGETAKAHDDAVQALKDTEAAWVNDIRSKDVEKWVSYYTDDASLLMVNAPVATGKDAIRNMLGPFIGDQGFEHKLSALCVYGDKM